MVLPSPTLELCISCTFQAACSPAPRGAGKETFSPASICSDKTLSLDRGGKSHELRFASTYTCQKEIQDRMVHEMR